MRQDLVSQSLLLALFSPFGSAAPSYRPALASPRFTDRQPLNLVDSTSISPLGKRAPADRPAIERIALFNLHVSQGNSNGTSNSTKWDNAVFTICPGFDSPVRTALGTYPLCASTDPNADPFPFEFRTVDRTPRKPPPPPPEYIPSTPNNDTAEEPSQEGSDGPVESGTVGSDEDLGSASDGNYTIPATNTTNSDPITPSEDSSQQTWNSTTKARSRRDVPQVDSLYTGYKSVAWGTIWNVFAERQVFRTPRFLTFYGIDEQNRFYWWDNDHDDDELKPENKHYDFKICDLLYAGKPTAQLKTDLLDLVQPYEVMAPGGGCEVVRLAVRNLTPWSPDLGEYVDGVVKSQLDIMAVGAP